mgnify:FL=1
MRNSSPIHGANLLADTRNYAWHRPPDIVDYDPAVEYIINRIDDPYQSQMVMAMLDIEAQVSTIVSTLLLQAVSIGKMPIDLAIIIAGPVARYVEILAKDLGKPYDMGVRDKDAIIITPSLLKQALGIVEQEEDIEEAAEEPVVSPEASMGGLMAMPDEMIATSEEQDEMLGGADALEVDPMVEEELEDEL